MILREKSSDEMDDPYNHLNEWTILDEDGCSVAEIYETDDFKRPYLVVCGDRHKRAKTIADAIKAIEEVV